MPKANSSWWLASSAPVLAASICGYFASSVSLTFYQKELITVNNIL